MLLPGEGDCPVGCHWRPSLHINCARLNLPTAADLRWSHPCRVGASQAASADSLPFLQASQAVGE